VLIEGGFVVVVNLAEDEAPRLFRIEEHIEASATHFALERSFRVRGNQIPKTLGERRLPEEFNEHASPPSQLNRTLAPRHCRADAIRHVGAVNRRLTPRERRLGRRRRSATERPRLIEARALTDGPVAGGRVGMPQFPNKGTTRQLSPKAAFDGQGDCAASRAAIREVGMPASGGHLPIAGHHERDGCARLRT
jgi:hypothetical protein